MRWPPDPRYTPCALTQAILAWPARRLGVAALAAAATVLLMGIPTALIPNPVFGREIAPESWAWPALWATAALSGLLVATYVRVGDGTPDDGARDDGALGPDRADSPSRIGTVGGLLGFLAVGCPVCNKIALIALGYTGAIRWFAPVQPVLAVAGIGLLAYALARRLVAEGNAACEAPGLRRRPQGTAGSADVPAELFTAATGASAAVRSSMSASTAAQPPSQ